MSKPNQNDQRAAFDGATATLARDAPSKPLSAILRVEGTDAEPSHYRLEVGHCVVGSGAGADLVIRAPTVSRKHLEVGLVPEGVAVRDLGSRNGTFFMGQRIEKMVLSLGAELRVGEARLYIEPDGGELAADDYDGTEYRGILASSAPMRKLFSVLRKLEGSLATVLIQGESGVGKELVARALHAGSVVSRGPLVVLNCGAIQPELIGSELFGHQKGAFTGAVADRVGAFVSAQDGTLFLDEVAELPLDMQPILLRALESREVRPLGSHELVHVNARVVAATNRDLKEAVAKGEFREDLYYRLAVITLSVPPLRERRDDIELIANRMAETFGIAGALPRHVMDQLVQRAWPGNVRELRNAIQVFAALGVIPDAESPRGATIHMALEEMVDLQLPYAALKDQLVAAFTRVYLEQLLLHTNGNQTLAARMAGLDRSYLGRLVHKHGLGK